jgi:plastocyanin
MKKVVLAVGTLVLCMCVAFAAAQDKSKSAGKKTATAHPVNINVSTGAAKPRHLHANVGDSVDFKANADCTVNFKNSGIFGQPSVDLKANVKQSLVVKNVGKTEYCVAGAPCPPKGMRATSDPNDITVP